MQKITTTIVLILSLIIGMSSVGALRTEAASKHVTHKIATTKKHKKSKKKQVYRNGTSPLISAPLLNANSF